MFVMYIAETCFPNRPLAQRCHKVKFKIAPKDILNTSVFWGNIANINSGNCVLV